MTGLVVFVSAAAVFVAWIAYGVAYARLLVIRWRCDPVRALRRYERGLRADARRLPAAKLADLFRGYEAVERDARRRRSAIRAGGLDADQAATLAELDQLVARGEARRELIVAELLRRNEYWRVVR